MGGKREIRAVLDTSVLLSAERRPLLYLATKGLYRIVWSSYIAAELQRKMLEMRWGQRPVGAMLAVLDAIAEKVDHEQILGGNYDVWLKEWTTTPSWLQP